MAHYSCAESVYCLMIQTITKSAISLDTATATTTATATYLAPRTSRQIEKSRYSCAGTRVLPDDTNNNKISHLLTQGATATIHDRLRRIADSNESP